MNADDWLLLAAVDLEKCSSGSEVAWSAAAVYLGVCSRELQQDRWSLQKGLCILLLTLSKVFYIMVTCRDAGKGGTLRVRNDDITSVWAHRLSVKVVNERKCEAQPHQNRRSNLAQLADITKLVANMAVAGRRPQPSCCVVMSDCYLGLQKFFFFFLTNLITDSTNFSNTGKLKLIRLWWIAKCVSVWSSCCMKGPVWVRGIRGSPVGLSLHSGLVSVGSISRSNRHIVVQLVWEAFLSVEVKS